MKMMRAFACMSVIVLSADLRAERYVVKDDAFGNTDAVSISDVSDEDLEELRQKQEVVGESVSAQLEEAEGSNSAPLGEGSNEVSNSEAIGTGSSSTELSKAGISSEQSQPLEAASQTAPSSSASSLVVTPAASSPVGSTSVPVPNSASKSSSVPQSNPFDEAYRQSEVDETDDVIKRLRAQGRESDYDATQVNPADFVDSEDLLQGKVNRPGEQPFYLTLDSEGEQDVVFYSPEVIRQEMERRKVEEQISDSAIHLPPAANQEVSLPEGADPAALAIFNSSMRKTYFERFVERCCDDLPNVGVLELSLEQSAYVDLPRDKFSYRFVDGDSRYGVVRLPSLNKKYLLMIKSFVRRFEDRGIDNGAFIPQIVVLDGEKRVKRIISNLSMQANEETWRSYGFLKAVIDVDQTEIDADRFLLIYTSRDDLRRYTVIDDAQNPWQIKHMEVGAVEVEIIAESLGRLN
jgi:hypothetical protein